MSKEKSYRELNDELDGIISRLQSSDLDVDQVVKEYEKASVLVKQLEAYLKSAGNKITKVNVGNTKANK